MAILKKIYKACVLALFTMNVSAQNVDVTLPPDTHIDLQNDSFTTRVLVHQINIKGNRRTKDYMIRREIQFKAGDSLDTWDLSNTLQLARQQVYNTTLFNEVKIDLSMISAYEVDVNVSVKERWYLFPAPQFQPIDRNLNEWLVKYKGDLSRVNYGVKFVHYNFSGRRDPLRIYLLNGYTRNISFSYSQPYSNRSLTQGFGIGGGFSQNREMAYKTSYDNQILFFKKEDFVKKNWYLNLSLRLQKGILSRQVLNLSYSYLKVNDSIITPEYNPSFFNAKGTSKSLIDFSYTWRYANVNNIAYPLKGVTAFASFGKRGLGLTGGINLFNTEVGYSLYRAHKNNWYTSMQFLGNIKLPFDQPYINQRALGYGETNLRGLEYYVVDAVAYALVKSTLRKKILSFSIPFPFKSKTHTNIPFTFFAKTYADLGSTYNKRKYLTNLNNRFLYSGGFGIDILSLYDLNLRLEYSFNQLGESGLFFKSTAGF
jgi:outer membrane protein assembly factor BamA